MLKECGLSPHTGATIYSLISTLARFRWVQLELAIFLNENPPLRLPDDVEDKIEKIKNEVGLPVLNAVYNDVYDMNTQNPS